MYFLKYRHNFSLSLEKPEPSQKEDALAKCIVRQINRIISNNLTDKVPHIISTQVSHFNLNKFRSIQVTIIKMGLLIILYSIGSRLTMTHGTKHFGLWEELIFLIVY